MLKRRKRKRRSKPMNPEKYALYMLNIKHRIHHILTMDSRNADIAEIKDTGIHIALNLPPSFRQQ